MVHRRQSTFWQIPLAVLILSFLVVELFLPILGFDFVNFDVKSSVVSNRHIQGLTGENLKYILTSRCIASYYPVRTLSYAVDFSFWGLNPFGFKLTNGLIHWANVMLVFWLVLRLFSEFHGTVGVRRFREWEVGAASFAAAVFAVHPVVVEPVTWVAGREELLMVLGALACFHFHLSARNCRGNGRAAAYHAAATVSCAFACLSNAVAAIIPALIVTWDVLALNKPKWKRILTGSAALWVIAAATIALKGGGTDAALVGDIPVFSGRRLMLVLNTYWCNIFTLAWPTSLAISYEPLRPESFLERGVLLGAVAVCVTLLAIWALRRRRMALFGLLWFCLALAPAAQILPHHVHRADRFLYLPLVGIAVALAAAIRAGAATLQPQPKTANEVSDGQGNVARPETRGTVRSSRSIAAVAIALGLLVLFFLDLRSKNQVQTWRDSIAMWENCVKVCPTSAFAHDALARTLRLHGELDRAEEHARRSMELDFIDNHKALCNRAMGLALFPDLGLPDRQQAVQLARRACELTHWKDKECLNALATAHCGLANARLQNRQYAAAIENYYQAIEADSRHEDALFQLAILLMTCEQQDLRNPDEAVRLAKQGCNLPGEPTPDRLGVLSQAYLAAGRPDMAITTARRAAQIAQANGDTKTAEEIRSWLKEQESPSSPAAD